MVEKWVRMLVDQGHVLSDLQEQYMEKALMCLLKYRTVKSLGNFAETIG